MSGIVVGIDGSAGSERALEWAAAEARTRKLPLTLVSAWHAPSAAMAAGMAWGGVNPGDVSGELRTYATKRLDAVCREHADELADVEVMRSVVQDSAAPALIDAAEGADLLVVGTRGHGGFAGLLLGSVSQQCVHHSPCPIVVVPPPTG